MHAAALERLDAGDIRDAAEKAWGATLRATNALILTRTGVEPEKSPATSGGLNVLASQDPAVRKLVGRYYSRQSQLHGECFYLSLCDPRAGNGTPHPRNRRVHRGRRTTRQPRPLTP